MGPWVAPLFFVLLTACAAGGFNSVQKTVQLRPGRTLAEAVALLDPPKGRRGAMDDLRRRAIRFHPRRVRQQQHRPPPGSPAQRPGRSVVRGQPPVPQVGPRSV